MLTEDIVALAVLKTGRPVKLEFTRQEQFSASTSRHPMRIDGQGRRAARRPADRDFDADALQHRRLRQSRPGRAVSRLRRVGRALSLSQQEDRRLCRLYQHDAERRLSRLRPAARPISRSNRRWTKWRGRSASIPFAFRRLNVVRPGDPLVAADHGPHDVEFGSYGLDQCLDLVEARLTDVAAGGPWRRMARRPRRGGGDDRHHSAARPSRGLSHPACRGRALRAFRRHRRVWQRHDDGSSRRSLLAFSPRRPSACASASPTPTSSRMTRAPSAAPGQWWPARRRGRRRPRSPMRSSISPLRRFGADRPACKLAADHVAAGAERFALAEIAKTARGRRQCGSKATAIRRARHVRSPSTCRASRSQCIGATAKSGSCEASTPRTPAWSSIRCNAADRWRAASRRRSGPRCMKSSMIDADGRVANPTFRGYHIPAFADVARHRSAFRHDLRPDRAARRQIDERKPL